MGKADGRLLAQRRDLRHHDRLALRQPADEGSSTASTRCRRPARTSPRSSRSRAPTRTPSRCAASSAPPRRRPSGRFAEEIVPVEIARRQGRAVTSSSATSTRAPTPRSRRWPSCRRPFREGGTVTAGNASGVNDGACARCWSPREAAAKAHGLTPRARIVGVAQRPACRRASWASARCRPPAKLLARHRPRRSAEIDVIELNEAFAAQALAVLRELGLADDAPHVNPNGGAIALGHPLGMSGARLVTTAAHRAAAHAAAATPCAPCASASARASRWSSSGSEEKHGRTSGNTGGNSHVVENAGPENLSRSKTPAATRSRRCNCSACAGRSSHAYDNVAQYRAKFDEAGVHPDDLQAARRPARSSPSPPRRTCATTIPSACSPCRASRSCASTPRAAPPASRPWSATRRTDIDTWAELMARSIRAAGGRPGDMVHVAYGYGLFTGGLGAHYGAERLGCTVIPISGGKTERQVQLILRLRARHHHGCTPSYMLDHRRRVRARRARPAQDSLQDRHLRRRALDRARCAQRSRGAGHRRRRHLRPVAR